ncbi:MAG: recombinase family protein [Egibacteraceae bacterium]
MATILGTRVRAAAVYARISFDRHGDGLGVARQEQLCRDLAQRKGWPVAEVYVDNDVSAFSGCARPAYRRMLDDLACGRRDAVLVVDTDRLTRRPAELEEFITLADGRGIALANCAGDFDLSSSEGRFKARIMGAVAREESEKKRERQRRQRDQAALLGKPSGGRRPFGYSRDGLGVVEHEAALVREAAARVLAGETVRAVAAEGNERAVTTSTGAAWTVATLSYMLRSPRYAACGCDAVWPAILDRLPMSGLGWRCRPGRGGRAFRRPTCLPGWSAAVCAARS